MELFFEQWGVNVVDGLRRTKNANGRELDGLTFEVASSREDATWLSFVGRLIAAWQEGEG